MVIAFLCSTLLAMSAQTSAQTPAPISSPAPAIQQNATVQMDVVRAVGEQRLADGAQVYQMELLYVDVTLDFERKFLEQQMVDLWRKPLDLQVELSTPWAEESALWSVHRQGTVGDTSLVINHSKGMVQRLADSADGRVRFRVRRELLVTHLGALQLSAAWMKFAWATRFEDDLVRGAVPLDRQETTVASAAWSGVAITPPDLGKPTDFYGAIGRYTMELEAQRASQQPLAAAQELLEVRISIRGVGYLNRSLHWNPKFSDGFHPRGAVTEILSDGVVWAGEVLSTHPGAELPAITWSYFDPSGTGHYQTLQTAGNLPPAPLFPQSKLPWIVGGSLLFVLGMFHVLRRRAAPRTALVTAKMAPPTRTAVPHDLIDHLAVHLACRRADIYADDLHQRLVWSGLPVEFAAELHTTVKALVQARYAEQGEAQSQRKLAELTERLRALRT